MSPFRVSKLYGAAMLSALALACTAFAAAPDKPGSAPAETMYTHTTSGGEALIKIAKRLLEEPSRWREILKFNPIDDPHQIKPGQSIQIPARLLKMQPATGELTLTAGDVKVDGRPAGKGTPVSPGQEIAAGPDSAATIRLNDGSQLLLQSNSRMRIVDLKQNPASGGRRSLFDLVAGRVEVLAQPRASSESRFEIRTQTAIAGVRGTSFRVTSEPGNMRTEVLTGTVAAATTSATMGVDAGFGTRVDRGRPPIAPRALLAAPAALGVPADAYDENSGVIRFDPVANARAYRSQVARDTGFEAIVLDHVSPASQARFADLPDGQYFVRVRAIDDLGLEGLNGDGRFAVRTLPAPPDLAGATPQVLATPEGLRFEFSWQAAPQAKGYVLQLSPRADFGAGVVETPTDRPQVTVQVPSDAGTDWYWRVRSLGADGKPGRKGPSQRFFLQKSV